METITLVATVAQQFRCPDGRERLEKGDEFPATPHEARVLLAIGRAVRKIITMPARTAAPVAPAPVAPVPAATEVRATMLETPSTSLERDTRAMDTDDDERFPVLPEDKRHSYRRRDEPRAPRAPRKTTAQA
jgi:hypothetical protein